MKNRKKSFNVVYPWLNYSSSSCFLPLAAENSSCNIHTEFECGNGECIDYQLTCDGVAHCKDKSDEKMQYCGERLYVTQNQVMIG